MPKISDLIEHLRSAYAPDEPCAYAVWTTADVESVAEEDGMDIETVDVEETLERVYRKHDATIGINWEVLREHITPKTENNVGV